MKGENDGNTVIIQDFNTPLVDRLLKKKINTGTQALNNTLDQVNLIDVFRTFHTNAEEYTFFSKAYRIFSMIYFILDHKSSLKFSSV